MKEGWYTASSLTRVYFEQGKPIAVATLAYDLDVARDVASEESGETLPLGVWCAVDDSPHSNLVAESWGQFEWQGNWLIAGVVS